jgi:hypothetical protein
VLALEVRDVDARNERTNACGAEVRRREAGDDVESSWKFEN